MNDLVSIGVPVHNGGIIFKTILNKLVNQTYKNIEIIISNNFSTDETDEICKTFIHDKRIIYFKQDKKITQRENFNFVLNKSKGNYFCWVSADDIHSINFVKKNLDFLKSNKDYVGSISKCKFVDRDFNPDKMGDKEIKNITFNKRLKNLLSTTNANMRFYSLFQSNVLKKYKFQNLHFFGDDLLFIIFIVKFGKLNRLMDDYIIFGKKGVSNQNSYLNDYFQNKFNIFYFKKLLKYSLLIFKNEKISIKLILFYKIIFLNFIFFFLHYRNKIINMIRNDN